MFIVKSDGKIDFVSDNVKDFLGFPQDALSDKVIYNYIHQGDHARFSVNLEPDTWKTWKRIPQNRSGRQVFDRSKVFHLRFRLNNAIKNEDEVQRVDYDYENMQVSAIVMLNPIEEQGETPKSGLFCIARKINANERSELTPVEQFTTKASRDNFVITTVDTSGLPELYVKNIESQVLGKTLLDLVHPHDVPLLREHIQTLVVSESDTSKVYRMVLPPPHNVVHVKTKSRIFTPQPGFNVPGYIMSTHAIIRENELKEDDLPGLRPQLRGIGGDKAPPSLEQMVLEGQQQSKVTRVNSPQVQSPPLGASQDTRQGSRPPSNLRSAVASSPVPSSSPSAAASSSFSSDLKTELFNQLLSPAASSHSDTGPSSKLHFPSHHNAPATSPSNGGNELLKELLKPKEDKSRDENWGPVGRSSSQQSSSSSDNVTLVGLLNERPKQQEPPSELLKQLRAPPRASPTTTRLAQLLQGHKRPSSSDEGPANKQPPSLEKLLESRPDSRPIPPLPRKWSEVPQDKLPRDIVIDNRPPNNRNNNAGRARVLSSTFPSSSSPPVSMVSNQKGNVAVQSRIVQNTRPSPLEGNKSSTERSESVPTNFPDPSFNDASEFRDLMTDPVFSKILDNILVDDSDNSDQRKQQKIQRIEEELMGYEQLEQSMTPSVASNLPPGMPMVVQSPNQTRVVVTSVAGSGPAAQYAQPSVIRQQSAPVGRQQILQQRGPQGNVGSFF